MRIHLLVLVALASTTATVAIFPTDSAEAGPAKGDPCSAVGFADHDNDGHRGPQCGGPDCDDYDPDRRPGNPERCDGTLIGGGLAAAHDEDCNATTVHSADVKGDGDADGDGVIGSQCTNPWITKTPPVGIDRQRVRVVTKTRRVMGLDCDDQNHSVVPGAQICASAATTSVCAPSGGFAVLPTSSALETPPGGKAAPSAPDIDAKTGFATVACPDGTTCRSQPNGTGVCR